LRLGDWSASRTARSLFWAAGLFALVMALLPHPPHIPGEPNDKIQHITAFATLGLLGAWAYPITKPVKLLLWLSLFGATIELFQAIPVLHRDSDILDWLADTLASGIVLALVSWWRARLHRLD
jgi:VanZ family protein